MEKFAQGIEDFFNPEPTPNYVIQDAFYDAKAKSYMQQVGVEHFFQLTKAEKAMNQTAPVTWEK
jgi:hypothetical protein